MQVEGRVRFELRLRVPQICLRFIAGSLFPAKLIRSCGAKGPHSGLPQKTGREVVARMAQSPFREAGSDRRAEHRPPRPHVPREIARSIEILLMSGSLSEFIEASSYP